ncbi:type III restriction protein res subunit (plasmid) [Pseudarthrobacter chlorophenolicus A6]|uniref:Type III restriction protein res subunit n=1 Tax=Pseudarthrobacter chlorophenolicus (strain ATCC 700700 / DSM 12829 / CIP 107037 / JCM 12360 / KCTC 9906 / NCIMB 13794 / A6) TaxID=452863 RepID=B8HHU8_PSECP|nr:DEAD/DEAH box helicase family protein [Pseudarthrobacter chlorophenolicus]ACL41995.1 type III restriction protein res subunit [Pseudarthrobacter chlorophenolicus A6]SDQ20044.1 type III restriction enzyme [Pseudarthrobacter chlorophenolicus]
MKFSLTDYQRDVTNTVVQRLNAAVGMFDNDGARSAVGLTAPTGAGKTVIATAVLEKLLFGGGTQSPNKYLTVLWLTDDPALNEQSKDKILKASSLIQPSQIETLDATYDRETLEQGKIHFLNIQRLASGATSHVNTGDSRRWSLWETIGNTVRKYNRDFLLIVDEAHRGSSVTAGEKKTIMRTVLDGGPIEIKDGSGNTRTIVNDPAGIMLGISATPKKFEEAMSANTADRTLFKVAADTEKVRASGLIKDLIQVNHPTDNQPTDDTLLRAAVRDLVRYTNLWDAENGASNGLHNVKPLMVVQLPDKVSEKAIQQLVISITDEWPAGLQHTTGAKPVIVHSFGEKKHLDLPDGRMIPYVAPQNIQENGHIRVVLFKTALTTGWDCPRAEVMVSLRPAKEHTSIAQLIGRMVRTPVAGRIETEDLDELNTVSLYLPHYDKAEVATVVKSFVDGADVEVAVAINPVDFPRVPGIPDALWEMVLPKEIKPKRTYPSETARLAALGTRLDSLKVANPANPAVLLTDEVEARVKAILLAEYARLQSAIDEDAQGLLEVTYDRVGYDQYSGTQATVTSHVVRTSATNLRELKDKAVNRMPDAAGSWLYDALYLQLQDHEEAVVRLSALSVHEEVIRTLESSASALIDSWRQQLNPAVSRLDTKDREELDAIWHPHGVPIAGEFRLPEKVRTRTQKIAAVKDGAGKSVETIEAIEAFNGHLFADGQGDFPMAATGWEREVIEKELAQSSLIGWYRNPAGAGGLSVSYTEGGVDKSLYPDFLFFHRVDGDIVVDIVDPHNHSLGDTPGKWAALSRFARQHPGAFRRVTAVIRNKAGALKSLELTGRANTVLENKIAAASGGEGIAALFEEYGGSY